MIRGDFVDRGFAGEDAGQISRRAEIAGSKRPLALLHPGNIRRHDFLIFERVDLAAASGAIQESRTGRLEADLSRRQQADSLPIRTTGNCGPWKSQAVTLPCASTPARTVVSCAGPLGSQACSSCAHPLHAHRLAHGAGHQRRILGHVIGFRGGRSCRNLPGKVGERSSAESSTSWRWNRAFETDPASRSRSWPCPRGHRRRRTADPSCRATGTASNRWLRTSFAPGRRRHPDCPGW